LPPSSLYANKLYPVTVLHSDMFRIQTMHLKIEAFKLTTGPWNFFFMNMPVPGTKKVGNPCSKVRACGWIPGSVFYCRGSRLCY